MYSKKYTGKLAGSCQFYLANKLKRTKNVLNGTEKVKQKIKKQTFMR